MSSSSKFAKTSFTVALIALLIYFLPFVLEWDNSIIMIHDNLDSSFTYYVTMAQEGKTFALNPNAPVESIMTGLPRMFLPSGFNILAILCMIFPPYFAYLLNFIIVHLTAFGGMYLLLRKYILTAETDHSIVIFASLAFSLIPFYAVYGLTVAGIPLLLYSLLNFYYRRSTLTDYLICCLFPFYSFFVFSGIFILGIFFIVLAVETIKTKNLAWNLLMPFLLISGGYLIVEYQFFYQIFQGDLVTHRTEFVIERLSFEKSMDAARDLFFNLQYHASNPPHFIIPIFMLGMILGMSKKHSYTTILITLFIANVLIAFINCLYNWDILANFLKNVPLLSSFQWNRFYLISPVIWYVGFAVALKIVNDGIPTHRVARASLIFIFCYQFYFLWKDNTEYRATAYNLLAGERSGITFKGFYSKDLYEQIKTYLGRAQTEYRVGSVGLHPATAQFNGFQTIDSYQNNYLLSYKKRFRKIIAGEIEKNDNFRRYFDEWGNRCYLLVQQFNTDYFFTKWSGIGPTPVTFNFNKGPAVDYIFSSYEIANPEANGIEFLKMFETDGSIYKIHLYKTRPRSTDNIARKINSYTGGEGIIGISSEIDLEPEVLDSLDNKYELLPRTQLLQQVDRFKLLVIEGKHNKIEIIPDPSILQAEQVNIHILNNYWEFNHDHLTVAATTILSTPPLNLFKGSYSLIITAESSIVNNETSHIQILYGDEVVSQGFLPSTRGDVTYNFTVDIDTTAPLKIAFTNDIKIENNDRNFWMYNLELKKQ